ncbi:MAG: hypothetical protein ACK5P7_02110 [Bdellovibrio sp.]|jgi:uncharacterized membrane protein
MVVIQNILMVLVVLVTASCNYSRLKEEAAPGGGVGTRDLGPLNYVTLNQTVIGPQCLNCHSNQTGNKGNLNLETYQSLRANLNRIAFRSLEKRDMPPQGLPSAETAILKAWIEAGAPEQVSGPSEKPGGGLDQGPTGFAKVRDQIFAAKCLDCHSGVNPQGALDLTSLSEVRMNITKIFESVIVKQTMPIEPYPALSPKERKVLLNWIDLGMPE